VKIVVFGSTGRAPVKAQTRLVLLLFFVVLAAPLFSQTSYSITGISISGLKRTKAVVLEQPLKKFLGRNVEDVSIVEVEGIVVSTGILEPVAVSIEDAPGEAGKILVVAVREKWTIFPLPMFFADSGGRINGGLFFMDSNAFGLRDLFVAGGMYGSSGWIATAMYQYTPEKDHVPGWSLMGFYSRQDVENTDQHKTALRRYTQDSFSGSLGLNYSFTELFGASLSFSYAQNMLREHENPLEVPDKDAMVFRINPELSLRRSNWDGYFMAEQSVRLSYSYLIGLNDYPSFHSIDLQGNYEISIIPGFKFSSHGGLHYEPEAPVLFESSASSVRISILPSSFLAQNFAGASAGLEKYIWKFSQGTLSVYGNYQVVYSQGPLLGDQFDHGAAAGVNFYLSRLAIPAVGLGVAYNVAANEFQGSFSIGMSF
jgi:outer membrane protein assembly factor BamA